jgi:YVTN family beta-propeller protein
MKKLFRPFALSAALISFLASCQKNNPDPSPTPTGMGRYAFVINEGNFTNGIGSVSSFEKSNKALVADAFAAANGGAVLGSVVESMTVVDTKGYVVVNNSNKIEVVSLPDFKSLATITGLNQPRFLTRSVANPSRAYVTEWLGGPYPAPYTAGRVSVIDLSTNKVVSTIPVGTNPEKPVLVGGKLYVPNTGSSFLTVIDDVTPTTTPTTITLPTSAGSLVADKNSTLWALCGTDYVSQSATLLHFNASPSASTIQKVFPFPMVGSGSGLRISPDGSQLYYSYNDAEYRMNITDTALPTTPLIRRSFYGFDIDPATGVLYGTDALNYSNPGRLIRYQPDGTKLDSATVQVSPNGVVFY